LQPVPGYFIELTQHWLFLFSGCNQCTWLFYCTHPALVIFIFPKACLGAATITRVATSTWLFYRTHPALVIFIFGLQPVYLVILLHSPSTGYFYFPKSRLGSVIAKIPRKWKYPEVRNLGVCFWKKNCWLELICGKECIHHKMEAAFWQKLAK
jgi:hypothetical protein